MRKKKSVLPFVVVLSLVLVVALGLWAHFRFAPNKGAGKLLEEIEHIFCSEPESLWQLREPAEGETLAKFVTTEGEFTIKLFAGGAATAFSKMADGGIYDGAEFFRLVPDELMQTAAPAADEDIPADDTGLFCLRGAVGFVCEDGVPTTGLFVVTAPEKLPAISSAFLTENGYGEEETAAYRENGGAPELDGRHVIFGQVISGWSTIDRMMAKETEGFAAGYGALEPDSVVSVEIYAESAEAQEQ